MHKAMKNAGALLMGLVLSGAMGAGCGGGSRSVTNKGTSSSTGDTSVPPGTIDTSNSTGTGAYGGGGSGSDPSGGGAGGTGGTSSGTTGSGNGR